MPTPRSFFACSVSSSTGLVYVAGGFDEHNNPLAAAEAYNVEEGKWENLPPMILNRGKGCKALFLQGKFMVFGGNALDKSVETFDPSAGTWSRWEDIWGLGGAAAVTVFSGDMYVFIERWVKKYNREKNVWSIVTSLPQHIPFHKYATQWRDSIFVTGSLFNSQVISYMFNGAV